MFSTKTPLTPSFAMNQGRKARNCVRQPRTRTTENKQGYCSLFPAFLPRSAASCVFLDLYTPQEARGHARVLGVRKQMAKQSYMAGCTCFVQVFLFLNISAFPLGKIETAAPVVCSCRAKRARYAGSAPRIRCHSPCLVAAGISADLFVRSSSMNICRSDGSGRVSPAVLLGSRYCSGVRTANGSPSGSVYKGRLRRHRYSGDG